MKFEYFRYYFECPKCGAKLVFETDQYKPVNPKCPWCKSVVKQRKIKNIKGDENE